MRLLSFGTTDLPEYGGEHSFPLTGRSALIQLPNGGFDQDGQRMVLDVSSISWKATIIGNNIDDQVNDILREVSKGRGILRAEMRDQGPVLVTYGKMKSIQRMESAMDYLDRQPLQITFEQDFPFWLNEEDGWFLDTGKTLDSGLILGGLVKKTAAVASPINYTLTNDGNTRDIIGTLTFIPRAASSIDTIKVVNNANGMSFRWSGGIVRGNLAANQQLVIDFLTRTVERDGVGDYGQFVIDDIKQVEFMVLELDDNPITITASITGTVDIYWQYKRMYL